MKAAIARIPLPITIATGGLILATAVFAIRSGWPLRYYDEKQYMELAIRFAHGGGYELFGAPTAYRPPAWPGLLALSAAFGSPTEWVMLIPVLLMVVAAVLAGMITIHITGSRWGAVATPLVLAYPLNVYTASTLYPQAMATALLLGMWWLLVRSTTSWDQGPALKPWEGAVVGLMAALLALAVPTMIFTGVVVGGWAVWRQQRGRFRVGVAMALGLGVPILAWTIRNWFALHAFIPFSTTSGENLLYGNNANATATTGAMPDVSDVLAVGNSLDEVARDKYLQAEAVSWITQHPWDAFVLWLAKIANYFNPYNAPLTAGQSSTLQAAAGWVSFGVLIALVVVRLLLRRRLPLWRSEVLFLLVFLANAPVMAVFFTRTRFRQPLDATLIVVAAIPVAMLLARLAERYVARSARSGLAEDAFVAAEPEDSSGGGRQTRDATFVRTNSVGLGNLLARQDASPASLLRRRLAGRGSACQE